MPSYLGECRCGVCACVCVLTCACVDGEAVMFKGECAAVCARACVFLPARVSMAVMFKNIMSYVSECVAAFVLTCGVCACAHVSVSMYVRAHVLVCAVCVCGVYVRACCVCVCL
jgi:hypothetical protein